MNFPSEDNAERVETRPCRSCNESGVGPDYSTCQFCNGEGFIVLDPLEDYGPDDDEGDWWENDDDF